jgi:glycolate oxidase FAD binding subunit
MDEARAIQSMNTWAGQPLPLSGTAWFDGKLYVRLSGPEPAIRAAKEKLGGETEDNAQALWTSIRNQSLPHFQGSVWRLSIRSSTAPLPLSGKTLLEWNGSLRWVSADVDAAQIHQVARKAGGHALLYRGGDTTRGVFSLGPASLKLQQRIKAALDPDSVFGPGRLHPSL